MLYGNDSLAIENLQLFSAKKFMYDIFGHSHDFMRKFRILDVKELKVKSKIWIIITMIAVKRSKKCNATSQNSQVGFQKSCLKTFFAGKFLEQEDEKSKMQKVWIKR